MSQRPPHFSARAPRIMTYCDISVGSGKTMGRKTSGIKLEDNLRTRLKPNPRAVVTVRTELKTVTRESPSKRTLFQFALCRECTVITVVLNDSLFQARRLFLRRGVRGKGAPVSINKHPMFMPVSHILSMTTENRWYCAL